MNNFDGISFGEFLKLYVGDEYEHRAENDRIVATINDLRPGDPVPRLAVDRAIGATTICNAAALWKVLSSRSSFVVRWSVLRESNEINRECVAEACSRVTGNRLSFLNGSATMAVGSFSGRTFRIRFADLCNCRGIYPYFFAVDLSHERSVAGSKVQTQRVHESVDDAIRTAERRSSYGFVLVNRDAMRAAG